MEEIKETMKRMLGWCGIQGDTVLTHTNFPQYHICNNIKGNEELSCENDCPFKEYCLLENDVRNEETKDTTGYEFAERLKRIMENGTPRCYISKGNYENKQYRKSYKK